MSKYLRAPTSFARSVQEYHSGRMPSKRSTSSDSERSFRHSALQVCWLDRTGTLLTGGSITELQDNFGELCLIMHRADLLTALLTALGPEHVHLGAQCVGFRQDAAGVTAQFAEGSSARADVLIGADGLNSTVRTQLHGQRKPTYAGYTAWRAVVRFDRQQLLPGESWGRGARFGHIPMSNGHVYWYATKNAPEGERNPGGEKAELLRIFHGWHIPIHALIEVTDESAILRKRHI